MTIEHTKIPPQPAPRLSASTAAQLKAACGGAVHLPGEAGYDAARLPWNVAVDQRPAAVAYPADTSEVAAVVRAARDAGLRVAPQGTGHAAAPLGALDDVVLLRTSALNEVAVDPVALRARAGAGVVWEDVVTAAAGFGLAALHGSSPDVGVVGYSLGGGIGWYARRFGLQCNHVTAVELVTGTGEVVRADRESTPELFWALRGGGGAIAGIVTALEFDLLPIQSAYAGWLVWDWSHTAAVLDRWVTWAADAPDSVTTALRVLQVPPLPSIPEPLRGRQIVAIDGAVLADDDTAAATLAPLRELRPEMDWFTRTAAVDLVRLHNDPEGPTPSVTDGAMLGALPAAAQEAFLAAAGPASGTSLLLSELRQLGGALGRPDPLGGVLPAFAGEFALHAASIALDPDTTARGRADAARLVDALRPWSVPQDYLNMAEHAGDLRAVFGDAAFARLQQMRATYDPDGVVVANHPVPLPAVR